MPGRFACHQLEAIYRLPPLNRYEYLLLASVETGQAWGLRRRGRWALSEEGGSPIFPLWPSAEAAERCALDAWKKMSAGSISLDELIEEWLPVLARDGQPVLAFLTPDSDGALVDPEEVRHDMRCVKRFLLGPR